VFLIGLAFVPRQPPRPVAPAARFELVRIDDGIDPFGSPDPSGLPNGVTIESEAVSLGPETTITTHYFRLTPLSNESTDSALARIRPWLTSLQLPQETRIALGRFEELDSSTERWVTVGSRSYILRGAPIISASDLERAEAMSDESTGSVSVTVTLRPEAKLRLAAATREHVKRRLAILIDDRVESAPMVIGEIPGGVLSITLGGGEFEQQLEQATRLASSLSPR
jgi:preprotein translocase subunit SecD